MPTETRYDTVARERFVLINGSPHERAIEQARMLGAALGDGLACMHCATENGWFSEDALLGTVLPCLRKGRTVICSDDLLQEIANACEVVATDGPDSARVALMTEVAGVLGVPANRVQKTLSGLGTHELGILDRCLGLKEGRKPHEKSPHAQSLARYDRYRQGKLRFMEILLGFPVNFVFLDDPDAVSKRRAARCLGLSLICIATHEEERPRSSAELHADILKALGLSD